MKIRSQRSEVRSRKWQSLLLLLLMVGCSAAWTEDFASLCTDRTTIERVYYNHRTGTKPPFAEVLPQATLESLVPEDLKKEAVLQQVYGVSITPAMLDAEIQRPGQNVSAMSGAGFALAKTESRNLTDASIHINQP